MPLTLEKPLAHGGVRGTFSLVLKPRSFAPT